MNNGQSGPAVRALRRRASATLCSRPWPGRGHGGRHALKTACPQPALAARHHHNSARTLAIPLTVPGAIAVITSGKVADVDLGRAGDATSANLVSVGLSTQVALTSRTSSSE